MLSLASNHSTNTRHVRRAMSIVVLMMASTALSGCLVASHRKVDVTGREVSQAEFNAIKPGVTTEQEVLEKLGPATATTPMSDGGVMHTWTANKREESSGAVFLILASSSEKTTRQSLNVTCKNGMVTAVSMK